MYSIIILNKNKHELISSCLLSLVKYLKSENFEILIGDTGTQDLKVIEFYKNFKEKFPKKFNWIQLNSYHFSKNNNEIAKQAKGDYLIFLNNDTVVFDDSLDKMYAWMKNDTNIGVVGAKLLFGHNYKVQHFGIELVNHPVFGPVGYHPYANSHSEMSWLKKSFEVPAVTGACLMISKTDFQNVKGFDEDYEAEAQDVDLCFKVRKIIGKKIVINGNHQLIHLENGTRSLGEENNHDRSFFKKKWSHEIDQILSQDFQSHVLGQDSKTNVLIYREKARGDVLSTLRMVECIKEKHINSTITLKTEYPELVDNCTQIDRALSINAFDNFKYDYVYKPNYENSDWSENTNTWLEQMFESCQLPKNQIGLNLDFVPSQFEKWQLNYLENKIKKKYIVISISAGWIEKEWSVEEWVNCVQYFKNLNFEVVQIGGINEPVIQGAITMLNLSTYLNLKIIENASGAILLDSFPLHLAMNTNTPTLLLCCKTCKLTTWNTSNIFYIRNWWSSTSPFNFCRSFGCRLKAGQGLDNSCSNPILKTLKFDQLIPFINEKFVGLNVK